MEGVHYGCATDSGWCYRTVDVVVIRGVIDDLFDEVEGGDQNGYQDIVAANISDLNDYVSLEYWQGILDGALLLRARGDNKTISRYLIFKNTNDEVVVVCPFLN